LDLTSLQHLTLTKYSKFMGWNMNSNMKKYEIIHIQQRPQCLKIEVVATTQVN